MQLDYVQAAKHLRAVRALGREDTVKRMLEKSLKGLSSDPGYEAFMREVLR